MDTLNFDGSCDPNPNGRMGFGWLINVNNKEIKNKAEMKQKYGNTNNIAEYTALKMGLQEYVKKGGKGPLQIYGDSNLVINQMKGIWSIYNPSLGRLHDEIENFITKNNLNVEFKWVPRDENIVADELAMPESSKMIQSAKNKEYIVDVFSAPISEKLRNNIIELNQILSPGFKAMMKLKVGGRDSLSNKKLPELRLEAGEKAFKIATNEFPDDEKSQAVALRWMLRGLEVNNSIHKVKVDLEVNKNAKHAIKRI